MWWPDIRARRSGRLAIALILAGFSAGCFQPLYGTRASIDGKTSIGAALSDVDVG